MGKSEWSEEKLKAQSWKLKGKVSIEHNILNDNNELNEPSAFVNFEP